MSVLNRGFLTGKLTNKRLNQLIRLSGRLGSRMKQAPTQPQQAKHLGDTLKRMQRTFLNTAGVKVAAEKQARIPFKTLAKLLGYGTALGGGVWSIARDPHQKPRYPGLEHALGAAGTIAAGLLGVKGLKQLSRMPAITKTISRAKPVVATGRAAHKVIEPVARQISKAMKSTPAPSLGIARRLKKYWKPLLLGGGIFSLLGSHVARDPYPESKVPVTGPDTEDIRKKSDPWHQAFKNYR